MPTTAFGLAHLGGLAAKAAGFFATADPGAARTFGHTALRAVTCTDDRSRDEHAARCGTEIAIAAD